MNFVDTITIAGTHKRSDGALIVDARAARTGIQIYSGFEVGRPDMPVVRVFRSADEVFSRDTLASFAHRPITNDHPKEPVTADNWRDHAVGQTSDEVTASDIYVRVPLMVSDAEAIRDVENGKRELSPGYSCDLDWTPGKTQNGEHYDAQQRKIRVNHIAIVDRGRSGSKVRIGDAWGVAAIMDNSEQKPMANTRIITFDGLPLEVTDAAEMAINKLNERIAKLTSDMQTASAAHVTALADKDKTIGTLTADLELTKKKIPDGAALDKLVSDRTSLIGVAEKIIKDFKPDGLDNSAIRKAVVVAKLGDTLVKDRSDEQISAMFDAVVSDATTGGDPFRRSLIDNPAPTNIRDNGQAEYQKRISDAWKGAA